MFLLMMLVGTAQEQVTTCRTQFDQVVCTTPAPITPPQNRDTRLDEYGRAMGAAQSVQPSYSQEALTQQRIRSLRVQNEAMQRRIDNNRREQCRDEALTAYQAGKGVLAEKLLKKCK